MKASEFKIVIGQTVGRMNFPKKNHQVWLLHDGHRVGVLNQYNGHSFSVWLDDKTQLFNNVRDLQRWFEKNYPDVELGD